MDEWDKNVAINFFFNYWVNKWVYGFFIYWLSNYYFEGVFLECNKVKNFCFNSAKIVFAGYELATVKLLCLFKLYYYFITFYLLV